MTTLISRIIAYVVAASLLVGGAALMFARYEKLVADNATAQANIEKALNAFKIEKEANAQLRDQLRSVSTAMEQQSAEMFALIERTNAATMQVKEATDVLAKHDIKALLTKKQALTLRRVNAATKRTLGMFERATTPSGRSDAGDATAPAK